MGFSRLDTLEIRSQVFRKIGQRRAESYFHQLGRFFALKITKSEFDKLCIKTIGRQNIPLHNRLINSIIKNASVAKSPPSRFRKKGSREFRDRQSPLGKPQDSVLKSQSATELLSQGSRPPVEVSSVEEGEEVEQISASPTVQSRSRSVTAPLGVSTNLRSGDARNFNRETCQRSGELPDTRTLKNRLEKRLGLEGLKISIDSVSVLNSGLDAFMRRLIEPCLSLANTRCGNESVREMNYQYTEQRRRLSYVSMSDFCAGMELNPRFLGEDWPIHMEKICSLASDE